MKSEDQIMLDYCEKNNFRLLDRDLIEQTRGYNLYLLDIRVGEFKAWACRLAIIRALKWVVGCFKRGKKV